MYVETVSYKFIVFSVIGVSDILIMMTSLQYGAHTRVSRADLSEVHPMTCPVNRSKDIINKRVPSCSSSWKQKLPVYIDFEWICRSLSLFKGDVVKVVFNVYLKFVTNALAYSSWPMFYQHDGPGCWRSWRPASLHWKWRAESESGLRRGSPTAHLMIVMASLASSKEHEFRFGCFRRVLLLTAIKVVLPVVDVMRTVIERHGVCLDVCTTYVVWRLKEPLFLIQYQSVHKISVSRIVLPSNTKHIMSCYFFFLQAKSDFVNTIVSRFCAFPKL